MPTYYMDYINGNDAADGSTFATAGLPSTGPWKTITSGATAARIAPGDTIKIAKSAAPTSLGINGTWTDGSIPATVAIVSSTNATPIEITATAHGYTTGMVIFVTGHATNTNANGLWVVTYVGVNTFTLDGSVGNGTGSATGTVCNYNCAVVKLASTLNVTLSTCDVAWTTADAGKTTCTLDTADWKEGYGSAKMAIGATLEIERSAHTTITSVDLSGYRQVSFWIKSSVALAAGDFTIRLCSDTGGTTSRNTISIPAIVGASTWTCCTVDYGGALYNGIQSVALYQAVDKGACNIWLDNIIACKDSTAADSLSLTSLISLNSNAAGGTDPWYGIQSIKGTLVMLDNQTSCTPIIHKGWAGTTTTATTYKRETIKTTQVAAAATVVQATQEAGTAGAKIIYLGGCNTSTGDQDGETFFDGANGFGYGLSINTMQFLTVSRLSFVRYHIGLHMSTVYQIDFPSIQSLNNNTANGLFMDTAANVTFTAISGVCNNRLGGIILGNSSYASNNKFTLISNVNGNCVRAGWQCGLFTTFAYNNLFEEITLCANNDAAGVFFYRSSQNVIKKITTKNNSRSVTDFRSIIMNSGGHNLIVNGTLNEATTPNVFYGYPGCDDRCYVQNTGVCYGEYATSTWQTATKHGSVGAWAVYIGNANRNVDYPFIWKVGRIQCAANTQYTIKVWISKSHATNVVAKLVIPGLQLAGIATDVVTTKASDTDWQQLSVQGQPTVAGVLEIEVWSYYSAAVGTIYIDSDIEVS
jgi:hypothetical protein